VIDVGQRAGKPDHTRDNAIGIRCALR